VPGPSLAVHSRFLVPRTVSFLMVSLLFEIVRFFLFFDRCLLIGLAMAFVTFMSLWQTGLSFFF